MNNKKILLGLTVLATPFVVENIVEVNVASANQTASARTQATQQVAKSSEYVLNKPAKAYMTANDAAKRVNQKATYQAGTYQVYNQSQGMVNISKASGKAGSWINPVDSPNAKKVTTGSVATTKATPAPAPTQVTNQAVKGTSLTPTTSTKPVSQTTQATTNAATSVKGTNLSLTPPKSGQYSLLKPTEAYINAVDASKKVNAKGTVSAGNYYIFREHKGMLNVSRAQGKVGSWINPSSTVVVDLGKTTTPVTETKQTTPVTNTKVTSPVTTTTPAPEKPTTVQTVGTKTSAGLYALTSATEAYVNAVDASKKVNARGMVTAGNYHIFREYKGMLNISKAEGKAGSWINPGLVATALVPVTETKLTSPETNTKPTSSVTNTPTPEKTAPTQTVGRKTSTGLYALTSATEAYMNVTDASRKENARGMVSVGNYHIFREYKGMLNISRAAGKPGSWINPGLVTTTVAPVVETKPTTPVTSPVTTTTSAPEKSTTVQTVGTKTSAGLYALTKPTEAYMNVTDASRKVNAKGIVTAGNYHIFREYKGMLNISRAAGKPGSWINPGLVTTTVVPVVETKPMTPATNTKPTSPVTTTTTQTVGTKTRTGQYALTKPTEAYMNVTDASRKVNARGMVSAGNYHIFREYKGMLNISRVPGQAGSWINPGVFVTAPASVTNTKPTTPVTPTTTRKIVGVKTSAGTYALVNSAEVYLNAADASNKVNAKGKLPAGNYHIYREYKGMLNISTAKGKIGSWINPTV